MTTTTQQQRVEEAARATYNASYAEPENGAYVEADPYELTGVCVDEYIDLVRAATAALAQVEALLAEKDAEIVRLQGLLEEISRAERDKMKRAALQQDKTL